MSSSIEKVVEEFRDAEAALRALVEQADSLRTAESRVDIAWTSLESAGESLGESRETLDGLAASITSTANSFSATSHELRAAASALVALDPERIIGASEETEAAVHQLGSALKDVVEARTSAVTDAVVASVRSASSDLDSEFRAVTARLDEVTRSLTGIDAQLADLQKRQMLTLAIVSLSAVFVLAALVLLIGR